MEVFRPRQLEDLFRVFPQLEMGKSVALVPPAGEESMAGADNYERKASIGIFSSGSTGIPKMVWCDWEKLLQEVRHSPRAQGWRWASSFLPHTFAGLQVVLQAWKTGGSVFSLSSDWTLNWEWICDRRPEAISCTPTFLDLLAQHETGDAESWMPRQITLGGEVLRPNLGERLRRRFPSARFTVIYAAAEFGVVLKTHRLDGWYELESMGKRYSQWRIREAELELKVNGEWRGTGDLAELHGDSIRILGRSNAVANIGGMKVNLPEISRLAEEVPGVARAVACVEPNSIVGQIVCLRYAVECSCDPAEVRRSLESHLRSRLPKEAWPRKWEPGEIGLGQNSKRILS